MSKHKPGLSLDEHVQLGAELAAMRDRLGDIAVQLGNAYPVALGDQAVHAQMGVDKLRAKLDNNVFEERPECGTQENASVYYPERR